MPLSGFKNTILALNGLGFVVPLTSSEADLLVGVGDMEIDDLGGVTKWWDIYPSSQKEEYGYMLYVMNDDRGRLEFPNVAMEGAIVLDEDSSISNPIICIH